MQGKKLFALPDGAQVLLRPLPSATPNTPLYVVTLGPSVPKPTGYFPTWHPCRSVTEVLDIHTGVPQALENIPWEIYRVTPRMAADVWTPGPEADQMLARLAEEWKAHTFKVADERAEYTRRQQALIEALQLAGVKLDHSSERWITPNSLSAPRLDTLVNWVLATKATLAEAGLLELVATEGMHQAAQRVAKADQ